MWDETFTSGQLNIRMVPIVENTSTKKVFYYFEHVITLVFVVDLTQDLHSSLISLVYTMDSDWFTNSSVLLWFINTKHFRDILLHSPLSKQFPDYLGGSDLAEAQEFLFLRFRRIPSRDVHIYLYFIEDAGHSYDLRMLFSVVYEVIRDDALRPCGPF